MAYGPDGSDFPDAAPGPRRPRPVDAAAASWAPGPDQNRPRPRPRPQPRPEYDEYDYRPQRPQEPQPRPGAGAGAGARPRPGVPPQRGESERAESWHAGEQTARVPVAEPQDGVSGGDGERPGPGEGSGGRRGRPGSGRAGAPVNRRKGKKPRKPVSKARRRWRIAYRSVAVVLLVVISYVGYTLEPYLTYPGSDTISARVAEWGRDHHLGWAVTWLENTTYKPPPVGGALSSQQVQQLQGATVAPTQAAKEDLPTNITPLAAGHVPDEGVWHPAVLSKTGVPVVEWAGLRPDAQHTSALAYVAWMNQKSLTFQLHPGSQQPGGTFPTPDEIPSSARSGLVATWNGGFKVNPNDSLSGYYEDGHMVKALVDGKASEIFYKDGSIKIGMWGRDESMSPQIAGVRQNLSLLVDNGQVMSASSAGSGAEWGVTVNNAFFVPRSGVGITATGDIVYAGGPNLSVLTLAQLLKQAGAVNAMELDINADWTSYMYYTVAGGGNPADPTPNKLWDFLQPADRYYGPSSRDFVAVYMR